MNWEKSLHVNIKEMQSDESLRNDFERIFVSTLGSQLYCERKIEFDIEYQPEDTEVQIEGTEIHDAMIPVEPVETEQLIEDINTKPSLVSIFPVFMKYKGVVISGIHDGVYFEKGLPKYLFEIKTTRNPSNLKKVWDGERLQSIIYALSLEYMGFDISKMKIVIPKVMQDIVKESMVNPLINYLENNSDELEQKYGDRIKVHKFSLTENRRKEVISKLDFLVYYWLNKRDARFSGNKNKCRPCDYKNECSYYKNT